MRGAFQRAPRVGRLAIGRTTPARRPTRSARSNARACRPLHPPRHGQGLDVLSLGSSVSTGERCFGIVVSRLVGRRRPRGRRLRAPAARAPPPPGCWNTRRPPRPAAAPPPARRRPPPADPRRPEGALRLAFPGPHPEGRGRATTSKVSADPLPAARRADRRCRAGRKASRRHPWLRTARSCRPRRSAAILRRSWPQLPCAAGGRVHRRHPHQRHRAACLDRTTRDEPRQKKCSGRRAENGRDRDFSAAPSGPPGRPADKNRRRKLAIGVTALRRGHDRSARLDRHDADRLLQRRLRSGRRDRRRPAVHRAGWQISRLRGLPPFRWRRPSPDLQHEGAPTTAQRRRRRRRRPDTIWKTDAYRQQFPHLSPGTDHGVVRRVRRFRKVAVESPSADTIVEIRVSPFTGSDDRGDHDHRPQATLPRRAARRSSCRTPSLRSTSSSDHPLVEATNQAVRGSSFIQLVASPCHASGPLPLARYPPSVTTAASLDADFIAAHAAVTACFP